jgi:hypothetical protein
MQQYDRVLKAALAGDVSHGAFRLYVILEGVSRQLKAEEEYFPVTLEGLMQLHPGIGGKNAGATTIIKQVASLRRHGLLDTRAAIHRNEPRKPVLVKVLSARHENRDLAAVANTQ